MNEDQKKNLYWTAGIMGSIVMGSIVVFALIAYATGMFTPAA